ncbi:MAG TPA: hypothetical protein VNE38_12800 [Ktedonobacteraceae bacterium]|nr:hypothetical protein [Ktedonobacteraceae bacterium]
MRATMRFVLYSVAAVATVMALILGLHLGGPSVLKIGRYSQLIGAFIGGLLTIISVNTSIKRNEDAEPWLGRERLAWTLTGLGCMGWGIGECFWRYYLAHGNPNPFPSAADFGYSSLPPLIFLGLVLQPSSGSGRRRAMVLLDSLISMGAMLAIAWFLLLGSLAQTGVLQSLGNFLGIWYPTSDIALLSCVVFLLIRGQGRVYQVTARRTSLLILGIGLCVFATSDFIFNLQQAAGTYVDGTWIDLGWPFGMMIMGVAAYLRRYLPSTSVELIEQRVRRRDERAGFGPAQIIPYVLLAILFIVLATNVLSNNGSQSRDRPVLVFTTLVVVALLVVRQIMTQLDNERLARRQAVALDRLEVANSRVEEQARMITERNLTLEEGIAHLKEVQAQLANGNLRARAGLSSGELMPLARSLNLMADRLVRFEQTDARTQKLSRALAELSMALERYRVGSHFVVPASCNEFPEIHRLLLAMGLRQAIATPQQTSRPLGNQSASQSLNPRRENAPVTPRPDQQQAARPLLGGGAAGMADMTRRAAPSHLLHDEQKAKAFIHEQ